MRLSTTRPVASVDHRRDVPVRAIDFWQHSMGDGPASLGFASVDSLALEMPMESDLAALDVVFVISNPHIFGF